MDKTTSFDFMSNWYELWLKQSSTFFNSAEDQIGDLFKQGAPNPKDHHKQIQQWLAFLKKQWQFPELNTHQKEQEIYWKVLEKMCTDAADMMMQQWRERAETAQPINNIRELYELWLNCCHEQYQKSMQEKAYQAAYGEFMNHALKMWKSVTPK